MVFSSIVFLCLFLPLVIVCYVLCPLRMRNLLLLLASLIFYAWGEPRYVLIMLFSTVFDYVNGRLIEYARHNGKNGIGRLVLCISVIGNLGILSFFKYTDFVIQTVNDLTGAGIPLLELALPIGISFYTFQTMSYTIDVYRGLVKAQHNLVSFGMYVCLFPQLIAGPIVRYQDVPREVDHRQLTPELCAHGICRFLMGLGKKVLFANQVGELWNQIAALQPTDQSMALAWLGALAYTFQIYFDFSGYSDMAIGLGEIFGFHFPENFRYPYESRSITEFWRRWHITLSRWFLEYLYIPMGGNRRGRKRLVVNLLFVWFLTGLWHGAGWNFVLWGLYYFVLLTAEKLVLLRLLEKLPAWLSHVYALFFIVFGWVIFANDGALKLCSYCRQLAGIGVPAVNKLAMYEWATHLGFLLMLAVASTHLPRKLALRVCGEWKHYEVVKYAWCVFVLLGSVALLISGSYNPFLYFRF